LGGIEAVFEVGGDPSVFFALQGIIFCFYKEKAIFAKILKDSFFFDNNSDNTRWNHIY
jgi:hypothetical protein